MSSVWLEIYGSQEQDWKGLTHTYLHEMEKTPTSCCFPRHPHSPVRRLLILTVYSRSIHITVLLWNLEIWNKVFSYLFTSILLPKLAYLFKNLSWYTLVLFSLMIYYPICFPFIFWKAKIKGTFLWIRNTTISESELTHMTLSASFNLEAEIR